MVAVTNAEGKLITAPRSPPGEAWQLDRRARPLFGLIGRKLLRVALPQYEGDDEACGLAQEVQAC
jgi:hypothetical protein